MFVCAADRKFDLFFQFWWTPKPNDSIACHVCHAPSSKREFLYNLTSGNSRKSRPVSLSSMTGHSPMSAPLGWLNRNRAPAA